jgi:ketosteroid isomerase-like protein
MRAIIIVIAFLVSTSATAQDLKTEINTHVWKTFIEGYNTFNLDKFFSVYSKNVVRVPIDEKKIFTYSEYRKIVNREYQFNKNYKIKAAIELRFNERIHLPDKAFEKGIFKLKLTDNNGKPETVYSRFEVLLQKESGQWKIVFDLDSAEGSKLTEKDFQAASAM